MNQEETAVLSVERLIRNILAKACREAGFVLIDPLTERDFMIEMVRSRLQADGIDPDNVKIRVEQKDNGNWDAYVTYPMQCVTFIGVLEGGAE